MAALLLSGCTNNGQQDEEVIKKQVTVQEIGYQTELITELSLSGTVVPKEYSLVRSLTNGTIEYIAPVGTQVLKGQPLFNIRDAAVESSFFSAQQNLEATNIVASQQVSQAELALNSSKARLDLANSSYANTIRRIDQTTAVAEDSGVLTYDTSYNVLTSVLSFLTSGTFDPTYFVYQNIYTTSSQERTNAQTYLNDALVQYEQLSAKANKENLAPQLIAMQAVLTQAKASLDSSSIVLQNALKSSQFSESALDSNVTLVSGYQTTINGYLNSVIGAQNTIVNASINNRLSLEQAQAQVDLETINFNNTQIALENARQGATLQKNAAKSQFDLAAYSYGNLSLAAPFSGTIMSHYAKVGEQASIGKEIVEVGNLALVEITLDIEAELSKSLTLGDEANIGEYKGRISQIEPTGDIKSGKVQVKVESDEAGLVEKAGEVVDVKVSLQYADLNDIIVPIKSVVIEANGNYVFVAIDGKVERRSVTLGRVFGDKVSVTNGLAQGDKMILLNGVFVAVGDEIEIAQ